jgi:gas vesicle protein
VFGIPNRQEAIMGRVTNFLVGAILGAMVGATVAILLAPASGEELRNQMQARANQMQIEVKEAAATRRAELEKQLEKMQAPRKTIEG